MAPNGLSAKQLRKKEKEAQDAFERLVNRFGLAGAKVAHYQSELGSLRIGAGTNAGGVPCGIAKWYFPELDQDSRILHYAWINEYTFGDSLDSVHADMRQRGEDFALEMLSGRVSKH